MRKHQFAIVQLLIQDEWHKMKRTPEKEEAFEDFLQRLWNDFRFSAPGTFKLWTFTNEGLSVEYVP